MAKLSLAYFALFVIQKLEVVQHHTGQKSPAWSMPPDFVRTQAECQYQFLKAISVDRPNSPTLADGLRIQEIMEAARPSNEGCWVTTEEVS